MLREHEGQDLLRLEGFERAHFAVGQLVIRGLCIEQTVAHDVILMVIGIDGCLPIDSLQLSAKYEDWRRRSNRSAPSRRYSNALLLPVEPRYCCRPRLFPKSPSRAAPPDRGNVTVRDPHFLHFGGGLQHRQRQSHDGRERGKHDKRIMVLVAMIH